MRHLAPETLARLVDAEPDAEEANHLAHCPACAAERSALRAQTEALGHLPAIHPPGGAWDALEARLLEEGLLHPATPARGRAARPWMGAAAALLLFLAGTAVGSFALPRPAAITGAGGEVEALAREELSLDAAEAYVRQTQEWQLDALLLYREVLERTGGSAVTGDPFMRVVMLDHLLAAAEVAVREAPADPFFNGLFVNTIAERQLALNGLDLLTADLR